MRRGSYGLAMLEAAMVAIPLLLLGTGLLEGYRLYRAKMVIHHVVEIAAESVRKANKQKGKPDEIKASAVEAVNRFLIKSYPLHQGSGSLAGWPPCTENNQPCLDLDFVSAGTLEAPTIRVQARMRVISRVLSAFSYTLNETMEVVTEDNQKKTQDAEQFNVDLS